MTSDIETKFHEQMLAIYENVGRRTGYWAYRFLKVVKKRGGLEAAKYFLSKPAVSEGFEKLKSVGLLKFSVEALVLQKPWSRLFTKDEIAIARERLENFRDAAAHSDKRDKRRLKNVFEHLRKMLRESDENDLIQWEKTFPIKETYKTDGWMIKLGNLGERFPRLELWIDHFPSTGNRCFWFGFYSNKKPEIQALIKDAPSRLAPKRVLTNDDFTTAGGGFRLKRRLNQSEFNQPIHEIYYEKYTHYGMFDSTDSTSQSAARAMAQRVAKFFVDVLQDTTPIASDTSSGELPGRVKQSVNRIIRDTDISRQIKRLYGCRCQVCGGRLEIGPGVFYAEAHHLKPLGGEHKGPDVSGNLMCLCPNHHALFDYFAMPLNPARLKLIKHKLGRAFVNYHNIHVKKGGV